MNKLNRAVVAGLAASTALLGTLSAMATAQTITIASWENLVTPPPPDPDPLPPFYHRPIGSSGIDGTYDFNNRSTYTSDTYAATNGIKSLKVQINDDGGGRFSYNLNIHMQEVGAIDDFLASGMFSIDVGWKLSDWDNGGTGNGFAGVDKLAVNSVGTGVGFLETGRATTDSARPDPNDTFHGYWDRSWGDNVRTLTWDLTTLIDGNAANNEVSAVQANSGGGFLNIVLAMNYDSAFNPATAAFYYDNVRLLPRVVASEWTGLAPDPDTNTAGNAAEGLWHASQNWTQGVPGHADSVATFGSNGGAISGAQNITLGNPISIGTVNFNLADGYTIGGTSTMTLSASAGAAALNVIAGNHAINTPVVFGSNTTATVPAGNTLTLSNTQASTGGLTKTGPGTLAVNNVRAASVTVNAGTVSVLANGTDAGASRVGSVSVTGGAFDLNDNDLVVTSSTYAATSALIASARNGGLWNGSGLTSSSAAAATPKNKTLGAVTGAQYLTTGQTTFDGFSVVAGDVLVKYTYYGDADLNGIVNFDDYARTDSGFNGGGSTWFQGDFDYNGLVNFDDYSLIDLGFNTQSGTLIRAMNYLEGGDRSDRSMDTPSLKLVMDHFEQFGDGYAQSFLNAVPEPSALLLAGVPALAGIVVRRRRKHAY